MVSDQGSECILLGNSLCTPKALKSSVQLEEQQKEVEVNGNDLLLFISPGAVEHRLLAI